MKLLLTPPLLPEPRKHEKTSSPVSHLEITELTTELPVSDLSPWSNQMMMAVMLSQQFFPYLQHFKILKYFLLNL